MAKNKNHHLYKRGDTWYFRKRINGKWIKKSLSTSVTEARRLRDELLKEIMVHGRLQENTDKEVPVFGALAKKWYDLKKDRLKKSTLKDYRNNLNNFLLPEFGNTSIDQIDCISIETFIAKLGCKNKRAKNILIPMRNIFKLAIKAGYIRVNPISLMDPMKPEKANIKPLLFEEAQAVIENVDPHYRNFFHVAFFTGMRFGEMAALKWKNVDFRLKVIKIRETRVLSEEGTPKTPGSIRDIEMLPPVIDALRDQRKATWGKSNYVFLNRYGRPLNPCPLRKHAWAKALKKAGLEYRSLMQTRHTYACLMLNAGVLPGYVMKQMGHTSLKMIYDHYYTYIKRYERDEGEVFMDKVYNPFMKSKKCAPNVPHDDKREKDSAPNSLLSLQK